MHILALCGSLRDASLNRVLLNAMVRVAPAQLQISIYPTLGKLPLFNPDIDPDKAAAVVDLYRHITQADALIIASPEYAHGVTGVIKNALDWMVGNMSFVGKPVALLNASPRAFIAQNSLKETLRTMTANVVESACVAVPILGTGLNEEGIVADNAIVAALLKSLDNLHSSVNTPVDTAITEPSTPTLTGLNHITLAAADLNRSFAFYCDVLGFRPQARWANGAYLALGDLWLCLTSDNARPARDYTHMALTIKAEDFRNFTTRLRANAVVEWQDNTSEGMSMYFLDPDGHQLEVHAGSLHTRLKALAAAPYDNQILY